VERRGGEEWGRDGEKNGKEYKYMRNGKG